MTSTTPPHLADREPVTSRRGMFWIPGERVGTPEGTVPSGPMFVQWEAPVEVTRPYPIVLVHGGGGQGTDWMGTPDGRPGWTDLLVAAGYAVYVVDRVGHGRSPHHPDVLGPMGAPFTYETAQNLFVGDEERPHWPGRREIGDPVLDQVLSATGPMSADLGAAQVLDAERLGRLLDIIGPAVVMTHSMGGPAGWLLADARPEAVRALVAVEPVGPAFSPAMGPALVYGVAGAPLTYDPPVSSPDDFRLVRTPAVLEGLPPTTVQAEPVRRLPNLAGVPIVVVSAGASLFEHFNEGTLAFLRQAGVPAERLHLPDHGVEGNGHAMMFERNSAEALQPILRWLEARVPATQG
ncbi:alpha/beta fold hydrolase [Pseudonocardia parietis]|uniref:Pimeloyl-ACP methyl ester carboxylesterase n=1 Tax=Pseudonocardia parietis TaxID=570936 RepID=A0ABS4VMM2_9PSEU|nr:alpha/beta fold hydrolase [Pseudonocardia parietis]MBP2365175.1 pimeloyl-ACP methyl ester carboxylesterase [Pseudonocardia parietis]